MAYDQTRLISDVRLMLGGVAETTLPDDIIIRYGDIYDLQYDGEYSYIWWKTTIACTNYLKINSVTSGSSSAGKRTEKVGNTTITVESSDSESTLSSWDDLLDYFREHPEDFGVISTGGGGSVLVGGVIRKDVDNLRCNRKYTSPFDTGSITSKSNTRKNPAFRTRGNKFYD